MLKFIYIIIAIFLTNAINAQNKLVWESKSLTEEENKIAVEDGKVLLIIESDIMLTFESSMEDIKVPEYKDGKYYLKHGKGAFALCFEGKVFGKYDRTSILFGQLMESTSLPALKNKTIHKFSVKGVKSLEWHDETEKEKLKGNLSVPIGRQVTDGQVILKIEPADLILNVSLDNNSAKYDEQRNRDEISFKVPSGNYLMTVESKDFGILFINMNVGLKESKVYKIQAPVLNTISEKNNEFFLKILSNYKCEIFVDGEAKGLIKSGEENIKKLKLPHGKIFAACENDRRQR